MNTGRLRRPAGLALAIAGLLTAGLTGCGSSPASKGSGGGGGDAGVVKIGNLQHLTGPAAASYGLPFDAGFRLGIDEVNASGVLGDVKLELVSQDVAGEVPAAVTGFNQATRDGVAIAVSPNVTPIAEAITPMAKEAGVLYLTGAAGVVGEVDNTFNLSDAVTPQVTFGEYAFEKGLETAVVITEGDNPAFAGFSKAFQQGYEEAGGEVVGSITVAAADSDFSSVLATVKSKKPDLVFMATLSEQGGNIIAQMRNTSGLEDVQIGGSAAWQNEVYDIAGKAANGAWFARYWAPGGAANGELEKKWAEEHGDEPPAVYAAVGYETAWIIAAGVQILQADDKEVTGDNLAAVMEAAAESDLLAEHGPISDFRFTPEGLPVYPGVIVKFDDAGQIVLADD